MFHTARLRHARGLQGKRRRRPLPRPADDGRSHGADANPAGARMAKERADFHPRGIRRRRAEAAQRRHARTQSRIRRFAVRTGAQQPEVAAARGGDSRHLPDRSADRRRQPPPAGTGAGERNEPRRGPRRETVRADGRRRSLQARERRLRPRSRRQGARHAWRSAAPAFALDRHRGSHRRRGIRRPDAANRIAQRHAAGRAHENVAGVDADRPPAGSRHGERRRGGIGVRRAGRRPASPRRHGAL